MNSDKGGCKLFWIFSSVHLSATCLCFSVAFIEYLSLLFSLLCSCGLLIKNVMNLKLCCTTLLLISIINYNYLFWASQFEIHFSNIMVHHQIWICLPDLSTWMVPKSWQECEIEQVKRERSWRISGIQGLVVLREGTSTFFVLFVHVW